jgi:hypothetical protein
MDKIMRFFLLIQLPFLWFLSPSFGQQIVLNPENDTINAILKVEITIINNTEKYFSIVPLDITCDKTTFNRFWSIDLVHDGHNYRGIYDWIGAPYGYGDLGYNKLKKIRSNSYYKFNICINLTRVNLELNSTDFANNSLSHWDTLNSKYGLDENVYKNLDYGKYNLVVKYNFTSEKPELNRHLISNNVEIEYTK